MKYEGGIRITACNCSLTGTLLSPNIHSADRFSRYLKAVATGLPCAWWHFPRPCNFACDRLHRCWSWRWGQILPQVSFAGQYKANSHSHPVSPGDTTPIRFKRVPYFLDWLQGTCNVHSTVAVWAVVAKANLRWPGQRCTGLLIFERDLGGYKRTIVALYLGWTRRSLVRWETIVCLFTSRMLAPCIAVRAFGLYRA